MKIGNFVTILATLGSSLAALHCSSAGASAGDTFRPSTSGGASAQTGKTQSGGASVVLGLGGSTSGSTGVNLDDSPFNCKGLQCQMKACPSMGTTSISGRVFDPSGTLPLYNVMVYVPNAPLTPLKEGAGCECEVNGEPIASALTDTNGNFVLKNAPVGQNIPLVIQIGKWRRLFSVPTVNACVDTVVPMGTLRLPARRTEGDMPKIALSTGAADALECLLRKLGIDPSEMTNPDGPGRVNYFAGHDGSNKYAPSMNGGAAFPSSSTLWASVDSLRRYDVVLLSCEGGEFLEEKTQGMKPMADYANLGGRVFASHWHQVWLKENPAFPYQVAQYTSQADITNIAASVVTTFPKGQALAEWLVNVQATPMPGTINLTNAQYTVVRENPLYAQRWIAASSPASVQYLSANTPLGAAPAQQCGRLVLSDLHVAGGAAVSAGNDTSSPSIAFPTGCVTTSLSPQEKVLAFMLFDITACLIPDDKRPEPPPVR